jgi:hypothetical protein
MTNLMTTTTRAPKAARKQEDAASDFIEMIRYKRPDGSKSESKFINRFLRPLGCDVDDAGNRFLRVGKSRVLWSSHTDTVHTKDGKQDIAISGDHIKLRHGETSNCLGADCTTGVWVMREMIMAGVPGLYVFHAAEECGGVGSRFIAHETPKLLDDIDHAIAFDRYGTTSIITHQAGGRCCSDDFVVSMNAALGGGFKADDGGSFTDTASYTDLVGECTNISVGYYGQHGSKETQDWKFMLKLRERMIGFDASKLVSKRKPGEVEPMKWHGGYMGGRRGGGWLWEDDAWDNDPKPTLWSNKPSKGKLLGNGLRSLVRGNPEAVAEWLEQYGVDEEEIADWIMENYGTVEYR